jgi:hypothetical protein
VHPPPSPARTDFTLITECTPESSGCNSVYSVGGSIQTQDFREKEKIRVKGKGRHFFSKIDPATSIFGDHEGQEWTFTLSELKNIAPSTPTLQKIEGIASVDLRFYLEKKV